MGSGSTGQPSIDLQALVRSSPLAIVSVDDDGRIQFCNPAFETLFRVREQEVIGLALDGVIAFPEDRGAAEEITRRAQGGESIHLMARRRRSDGAAVDVEIHAVPLSLHGERIGTFGFYQDVTERRRSERALEKARQLQAIAEVTAGVAHEFNNLLTAILGNVSLVADRLPDGEQRRFLDDARLAAERGAELVAKLMAYTRQQPLRLEPLALDALLENVVTATRRSVGEAIRVESRIAADLWPVEADGAALEAALHSLATNACQAMPEGGTLRFEAENLTLDQPVAAAEGREARPDDYIALRVVDSGCGIPCAVQTEVFKPFFTTRDVGAGQGLGLSMVLGVLDQLCGFVRLESSEGRGTCVELLLPRRRRVLGGERPSQASRGCTGLGTVLVVEDEPMVRSVVEKLLADLGYEVLAAADVPEALEVLETVTGIEVLLTDVVMPGGLAGLDLATAARQRCPELKVLYMSGYDRSKLVTAGRLPRGVEFMPKPFTRTELAARLRGLLGHVPADGSVGLAEGARGRAGGSRGPVSPRARV